MTKTPPHSIESEEAVIACCLLDEGAFDESSSVLLPEDFYVSRNRIIFTNLLELVKDGIAVDDIALLERLREDGTEDSVGGIQAIYAIMGRVETVTQIKEFVKTVKEKSRLRAVIDISRRAIEKAYDSKGSDDICAETEGGIIDLFKDACEDDTISTSTKEVEKDLKDMLAGTYERTGLRTGVVNIDQQMLDGLENGTVTVLSAPTSCGKSQLALNIIGKNCVTDGLAGGYFSYEMLSKQLSKRMVQTFSGVNLGKFRDQVATTTEQKKVKRTIEKLEGTTILTNYSKRSADAMSALARQWKRKHKIRILVIDYLQLLDPPNSKISSVESVSYNMKRVKALALELDIPIVILSQVNREAVKKLEFSPDRGLLVHDLIGGSAIEQDADNVILWWPIKGDPDESRVKGDNGMSYVHLRGQVAKQREGQRGVRFEMALIEDIGMFR